MYDHDLDVIGLIDSSDLVISAPFTSPGFVASERGVKSIFYSPGDIIEDNLNLKSENIYFINSTDELLRSIQEIMRKK
jgi:polysaccharide biosynthesis PFTS motif protein